MISGRSYFFGANEDDANNTLGTTFFNLQPNYGWVIFRTNPRQPSEF